MRYLRFQYRGGLMADLETSDGLVLFGGGGDLSLRMLFPALAWLEHENLLPSSITERAAPTIGRDGGSRFSCSSPCGTT